MNVGFETVERALKTDQVGTPVAVRIVLHGAFGGAPLDAVAAAALARAERWLAGSLNRLTVAGGGEESSQLQVLSLFNGGQSALVSLSRGQSPRQLIQVWGNRGTACWHDADLVATNVSVELDEAADALLGRIREVAATTPDDDEQLESAEPAAVAGHAPQATTPPYGVLLVAGDHTHQPGYAQSLIADSRCRLIGLSDEATVTARRAQLNRQLAERLEIPFLPDLDDALRRKDVHIVSVCAEPIRRGAIAIRAATAGKHLYLDKPLAAASGEAWDIVEAAGRTRVVDHMFSLVHGDAARSVRATVDSGRLGDLTALHFDVCFAKGYAGSAKLGPRNEAAQPDRFEVADAKRELTNVGVYPLVQLLTLVGGRKVRRVTAATGNYFFAEHQARGMEDFGQMLLELEGSVTATISAGRTGWRSHPGFGLNRVVLIGTQGTALLDAHQPRVEVFSDATPWLPPPRNPTDPMAMWAEQPGSAYAARPRNWWVLPPAAGPSDAEAFINCVEHGTRPLVSSRVAAEATDVLMGAYHSAATGRSVTIRQSRTR